MAHFALTHLSIHLPVYQLDSAGVVAHSQSVDIIVCVHNALDDVRRCLTSIQTQTTEPYRLIVIDDGSDIETATYLVQYQSQFSYVLLRNEHAKGYTGAANQGLRLTQTEYVILLNSDTIVTPHWLDRLIACAESDEKIGIVGPLSNTASWQSIPRIEQRGDWATNPLPLDLSIPQMAARLASYSSRLYPRLPFLNGFCLLFKRRLIEAIGYFDEANFAQGYGEENDYCIRARLAGWQLAVADNVYIYHAQSKSYSHERRKQLAERAGQLLAQKHGQAMIDAGVFICRHSIVMSAIRLRAKLLLERWNLIAQGQYYWRGKRVIFVLPVTEAGGGSNVVISEARVMQQMGVDACILNFSHHKAAFERSYPTLDLPVVYAVTDVEIPSLCMGYDAVVATANHSIDWVAPLADLPNPPIIAYYIQDFEPYFYVEKPTEYRWFWRFAWLRRRFASYYFRKYPEFRRAWISYLRIPHIVRFTKTPWNKIEVEKQTKQPCSVIGVSCQVDLFMPRVERSMSVNSQYPLNSHNISESVDNTIRISAMIRPSSPRRAPLRTMQVLRQIQREYGNRVEIILFGVAEDDPQFLALPRDFVFHTVGLCTPEQVANLFSQIDIFVDFSSFQAMGLTAMEAMACGVAVIIPQVGGGSAFAMHGKNALMIDTTKQSACYTALKTLIDDSRLRMDLQQRSFHDIAHFYPEKTAYQILDLLFKS